MYHFSGHGGRRDQELRLRAHRRGGLEGQDPGDPPRAERRHPQGLQHQGAAVHLRGQAEARHGRRGGVLQVRILQGKCHLLLVTYSFYNQNQFRFLL